MCTWVTLVQIILAKHRYISARLKPSSYPSSVSNFSGEYDTTSKEKEEQTFPLQFFDSGGEVWGFVVLKALSYLFDSLKKSSALGESCEGAQQLYHIPKRQDCKQVQERQWALHCN